jgi:hypothetical protein
MAEGIARQHHHTQYQQLAPHASNVPHPDYITLIYLYRKQMMLLEKTGKKFVPPRGVR